MRTERELLVDCLGRLNDLAVPYMLVGSMASNYWGIPRTTHDLDFVLVLQNADSLLPRNFDRNLPRPRFGLAMQ